MPEWKIHKENLLNFVEIGLRNEGVRSEAGALRYYQGPIEMKAAMPSLGGFFKSKLAGEKIFRPTYQGSGQIMLEASFHEFFALELEDEAFVLDRGAYWASDLGVEVSARLNNVSVSLLSGEGLVQTLVRGSGTVMVRAPGPVTRIDLKSDRLVVDGNFAVARSAELDFSVQTSTRSLFGSFASGEGLVNVLQGSGTVYLAPVPNPAILMHDLLQQTLRAQRGSMQNLKDPKG